MKLVRTNSLRAAFQPQTIDVKFPDRDETIISEEAIWLTLGGVRYYLVSGEDKVRACPGCHVKTTGYLTKLKDSKDKEFWAFEGDNCCKDIIVFKIIQQ